MTKQPQPDRTNFLGIVLLAVFASGFLFFATGAFIGLLRAILGVRGVPALDVVRTLMVLLSFCAIGGLALTGVVFLIRSIRIERGLQRKHPDQPWMWRRDWAEGESRHSLKGQAIAWAAISIAVCSVIVVGWLGTAGKGRFELSPMNIALAAIVAGFNTIAVFVLVDAIRRYQLAKRIGETSLELISTPFQPGDAVRAILHWDSNLPTHAAMVVVLRCDVTKVVESKYSDDSAYHLQLYDSRCKLKLPSDTHRSMTGIPRRVPIRFSIPKKVTQSDGKHSWSLEIQLDSQDQIKFEIPIFELPASDTSGHNRESEAESFDARYASQSNRGLANNSVPLSFGELAESHGCELQELTDGFEIRLPLISDTLPIYTKLGIFVMVAAVAYIVFSNLHFWLGIGALLLVACYPLFFRKRQTIRCTRGGIEAEGGLTVLSQRQRIAWPELLEVYAYNNSESYSGPATYELRGKTTDGREVTILGNCLSLTLANALRKRIESLRPRDR